MRFEQVFGQINALIKPQFLGKVCVPVATQWLAWVPTVSLCLCCRLMSRFVSPALHARGYRTSGPQRVQSRPGSVTPHSVRRCRLHYMDEQGRQQILRIPSTDLADDVLSIAACVNERKLKALRIDMEPSRSMLGV